MLPARPFGPPRRGGGRGSGDPTAAQPTPVRTPAARRTALDRFLQVIEDAGNRLPDPAILFVIALLIVWAVSALLAPVAFTEIDPRNGKPIQVQSQLTGAALAAFLANMVTVFVTFPPLG